MVGWVRSTAPSPSLTRDRDGHLCVFTAKGKSLNKSLHLFTPVKGKTITEGERWCAVVSLVSGMRWDRIARLDGRQR